MVNDMALRLPRSNPLKEPHGGNLAEARRSFPAAPEPWIDLSTGISPHSYPLLASDSMALSRLPEPGLFDQLRELAATYYGAAGAGSIVASPGTQPLLPLIAGLVHPGKARILGPTYSEHARCAALAGHDTMETSDMADLASADLAVVVNPDNPTGRLTSRAGLLELAKTLAAHGGLLVVDEAFMDVASDGCSLAGDVETGNIIVLRSFGKFFGLAGIRLSFAIAPLPVAQYLSAALGPWPVSVPALDYGLAAFADTAWQAAARKRTAAEAAALRSLLGTCGLEIAGGTGLFQLVAHADAEELFKHLGRSGILVRRFGNRPRQLRIGLPSGDGEWERLEAALKSWAEHARR